jgi:hypothetical protein
LSIAVSVKNSGDLGGSYAVELKVNGKIESTQSVTVGGDSAKSVVFAVVRDTPGSYEVSVGGLSGAFKVRGAPAPPAFSVKSLSISRSEISFGEETVISVIAENAGDVAGFYKVTFKIDGTPVKAIEVSLAAHTTFKLEHAAIGKAPGTFSVDVNGQTGSFTVRPMVVPPKKTAVINWWIIGGVIAAIISGAVFAGLSIKRRVV